MSRTPVARFVLWLGMGAGAWCLGGCAESAGPVAVLWPSTPGYAEKVKAFVITPKRAYVLALRLADTASTEAKKKAPSPEAEKKAVSPEEKKEAAKTEAKASSPEKDSAPAKDASREKISTRLPPTPSAIIGEEYFFGIPGERPAALRGYYVNGHTGAVRFQPEGAYASYPYRSRGYGYGGYSFGYYGYPRYRHHYYRHRYYRRHHSHHYSHH